MTASLRGNIPDSKREAHEMLDRVRAGIFVSQFDVRRALLELGDGAGQHMVYKPIRANLNMEDGRS